jgi:PAS domain S-box-containing protein
LRRYQILDTPPEEAFDTLAHLIAHNFQVPIALISLVDRDRVFFKGNVGMPGVKNMDRGTSLCSLAILSSEPTIIDNPLEDPCLLSNPLVHGKFGLRFYAGAPLITPDGYNIGTVCIVDKKERTFTSKEQEQLVRFAKLAIHEIEIRRSTQAQVNLAVDVLSSEKSFRTLAQNSPDLIVRHGKDFRYQYVSPVIERLTGKKPVEFIGKSYWQMGMPAHLCRLFDESLELVFKTQTLHHVEYTVQAEPEVHIYTRLVPEFDEAGQMVSVMTISTDVSEQKQAEAALTYQKRLLETVTDNTTLALFMLDNDRNCVYMNEVAEQMTGFSFEEVKGKNLHHQIHHTRPDGTPYP